MTPMLRQRKVAPLLPIIHSGNAPIMTHRVKRHTGKVSKYLSHVPLVIFIVAAIALFTFYMNSSSEQNALSIDADHEAEEVGANSVLHQRQQPMSHLQQQPIEEERIDHQIIQVVNNVEDAGTIVKPVGHVLPASKLNRDKPNMNEQVGEHLIRRVDATQKISQSREDLMSNIFKEFSCANGRSALLNDNYCDCPDGSDEPETSACSDLTVQIATFHCKDDTNRKIYASRVGDGVKDCPDGSDEVATAR